ncbi:Vacuolar fusion protein mon1b [Lunasporangiospora selenospora]|uniref:Vacuolar fusion protein MON1 n=1 Tax=Lunasporangiospora selenospora TaxID=979761 RepID=A0A9P6G358_9FUNG|nr:Vacuolar fusion protein mon1b [Lunasporangiospora selenospora]
MSSTTAAANASGSGSHNSSGDHSGSSSRANDHALDSDSAASTSAAPTSTVTAPTPTGVASTLSPPMPIGTPAFPSPIQTATSPRLMPAKSRPTTALVFDQLPPLHQQPLQNDTESLSSDEFALSSSSTSSRDGGPQKQGSHTTIAGSSWTGHSNATRPLKGLAPMSVSSHEQHHGKGIGLGLDRTTSGSGSSSESGDEGDGRLTDTEGEAGRDRTRESRSGSVSTPVIAGRSVHHHSEATEHGVSTTAPPTMTATTAMEALKEIEEHDRDELQTHGLEARFRRTLVIEQDQGSEVESVSGGGERIESTLDQTQIRDKLKVIRKPSLRLRRTASTKSYDSDDISNNHGGYTKHYENDDQVVSSWTAHRKHFFILSSAGKPIYARYGDESRISSYMGVIQALISFFADNDDSLRCINAGDRRIVFLLRAPLYLVCVSRTGESETQLRDQLGYLYAQIISVLTHSQMTRIFEQRNNFDLRGLIGGTEIFLDSLGKLMNNYAGFMLGAIQCLTMPKELRDKIGAVLGRAKSKPLLYAILLTPTQLITLLRPRTHSMHPSDLHLIFNLLSGSTTFESSESWTPLCLPKFNNKAFLHAYICYIAKKVCMLLISPDKDSFFEMSSVKQKVVDELESTGILASLEGYAAAGTRGGFAVGDTGIPGLRHFLYKSSTNVQYTMPELTDPYANSHSRKRLMRQYQHMHERMHKKTRPLKLLFHAGDQEIMLGWITTSFELYAAFGPLVSKNAMVQMSNKLLRWIRKQEENLLILNSPSFEKYK